MRVHGTLPIALLSLLLLVAGAPPSRAQDPPSLLHFQARLADSAGAPIVGPVSLDVRLYDAAAAGVLLWSETHAATALDGVVNVLLGSVTPLGSGLFDGGDRWLALRVGNDLEMVPRTRIASVPFARRAATVAALSSGTVIPNGLIQSAHVLDLTIATSDLADGSVTASKIAPGAVKAAALAAGAVTAAALAPASVGSGVLLPSAVDGTAIADLSVGTADLANGSVTSAKLGANAVTSAAIASSAVGSSQIANGSIAAADLASPMVSTSNPAVDVESTAAANGSIALRARTTSAGAFVAGLVGESTVSGSGRGVVGLASNATQTGTTYGVFGTSTTTLGSGVYGYASSTSGSNYGVYGVSESNTGTGVIGLAASPVGSAIGVYGRSQAPIGSAVRAESTAATGAAYGVFATAISPSGYAGFFVNQTSSSSATAGVFADHYSSTGRGVRGDAGIGSGGVSYGVRGKTYSASGFGVYADGDFGGNGAKFFVQPHPADASKEIRFVCLEGNESGTYFRGTGRIVGGAAVVEVPEEFRLVTEAQGLTGQLTPIGDLAVLCVESVDLDRVVVRGTADVDFSYFVNGVRRGYSGLSPIRENQGWIPEVRGVPFATQYPAALRRILVENGTLHEDFTPNEETAKRLGWTLREPAAGDFR